MMAQVQPILHNMDTKGQVLNIIKDPIPTHVLDPYKVGNHPLLVSTPYGSFSLVWILDVQKKTLLLATTSPTI